jgi:hypothetical protein
MQGMNAKKGQENDKKVKPPRKKGEKSDSPVVARRSDGSADRVKGGRGSVRTRTYAYPHLSDTDVCLFGMPFSMQLLFCPLTLICYFVVIDQF